LAYEVLVEGGSLIVTDKNRVVLSLKKGKQSSFAIDLRHYVTTKKYTGFTKKGVFFPISEVEDIERFRGAINELCDLSIKFIEEAEEV